MTSMRTPVSDTIFGTDASPDGAGLIGCVVGHDVSSEIFRRCDTRGFHTRLLSPIERASMRQEGMVPIAKHPMICCPLSRPFPA